MGDMLKRNWTYSHDTISNHREEVSLFCLKATFILRILAASFLDKDAIKYGNACNGALRSTACFYQGIVMGRNCSTGLPIDRPI